MRVRTKLSHLVLDVRHPDRRAGFDERILGLPPAIATADGGQGYRLDDAAQRLIVRAGKADDLAALGLELADEPGLDALGWQKLRSDKTSSWGHVPTRGLKVRAFCSLYCDAAGAVAAAVGHRSEQWFAPAKSTRTP